jgi:addiction module HigA family antidote
MIMKNPSHPGELVLEDILPHYGLNIAAAARVLGITRANLDRVLKGKAALSHELALKIEKAFGTDAALLTAMQNQYDLAQARLRQEEITAGVERQKVAA